MLKTSEVRTLATHPELKSHQSIPFFKTVGERPKNALERLLSLFADVRAGEGAGVLLMTVTVFLLLAAYYLLKVAREPLVLLEGGAVVKAYAAAAQAVLLLGVVPLFGWIASRVARMRAHHHHEPVLRGQSARVLRRSAAPASASAWRSTSGSASSTCLSSPSSGRFANDFYTEGQGRRLFPMIGVGGSLGAWLGADGGSRARQAPDATPYTLMLLAAVLLVLALASPVWSTAEPARCKDRRPPRSEAAPLGQGRRLRARHEGPLSAADRRVHDAAQRGQHHRRVPAEQPGERSSRWRSANALRGEPLHRAPSTARSSAG